MIKIKDLASASGNGFTLFELIVVLAIISAMVTVIVPFASRSNDSLQIREQSRDVAQTIRYAIDLAQNSCRPVKFVINPPFSRLQKLYSISKIYWHAAGYQVDQDIHPEATEHFGITVVEAMASGLVPLVVDKGGLPEIISHNQNGFLWSSLKSLTAKTQLLIGHPKKLAKMSQQAIIDCQKFSKANFENQLLRLISN